MVRSTHAHAALTAIDVTAARASPGVLGAFTAADLDGIGPIPCTTKIASDEPLRAPPHAALATGRVHYMGQPVAFVVAETAIAAQDAAELLSVDYDPLPCVTEAAAALAPGAPLLWPGIPGNCAFRFRKGDAAATATALAAADTVAEVTLVNNRVIVAPLEHRAAIAAYDALTETFDLTLTGQGVHGIRRDLAGALGVAPEHVQVRAPDVGGGFGVKNGLYPEYILCSWAARKFGRPVRWASATPRISPAPPTAATI